MHDNLIVNIPIVNYWSNYSKCAYLARDHPDILICYPVARYSSSLFWYASMFECVSMGQCKKGVTQLLTHGSYVFLALTRWFKGIRVHIVPLYSPCGKTSDPTKFNCMRTVPGIYQFQSIVWAPCFGSNIRKEDLRIYIALRDVCINSSPPGQNGRHYARDIFRFI